MRHFIIPKKEQMKNQILLYSLILFLSGIVTNQSVCAQKDYTLLSPNTKLKLAIHQTKDGQFSYSFTANSQTLIKDAALGFQLNDGKIIPNTDWVVNNITHRTEDTEWKPIWGKRVIVPDQFNELTLDIAEQSEASGEMQLIFRTYNDGIAFRYSIPANQTEILTDVTELTSYNFAGDYTAWFYNGENHNIGPDKLSNYDGRYMPIMTLQAGDKHFLALHEADLSMGNPLVLQTKKGATTFNVYPQRETLKAGYNSAWRVVLYGNAPGVLVDSHLIELLNPAPPTDRDFSWVKPGLAVWDWRIDGAIVDDFTYSMSYPSWVKMVDFAAEEGIKHLVLDANWYGPEHEADSDPIAGEKAADVQRLLAYGKKKGVGIWLYLNDVGGRKYPIEKTLHQYGQWGATGVKYGFMNGSPEEKNIWTRRITELCAKNKLLVNFHDGPVHPYGQMRTWPNAVTREFCHAQLDAHRVFQPSTFVTTVFVNMVAGPIDMNNGMFDLRQGKTTRIDENQPVPSTLVSEAARTLIVFSGATILPDIPEYYQKYPDLLRFISAQKMPWKESKTLDGKIGEYIVMMRQTEDAYLVGAATNESGRILDIPLSFLPEGKYELLRIQDGKEAHYLTNREVLIVDKQEVTNSNTISVALAPGGGSCLLIKKPEY